MDTLILQRPQAEKTATGAAGIGIAICLLLMQNLWISAKDMNVITGLTPLISPVREQQQNYEEMFEQEIAHKYKKFDIKEVDKGVIHIKMTKYYNHKPVRINIIELSQNVNNDILVEPAIASNTLASRNKIANIANRENAIIAINGGYFKPETGTPLGTLMINKELYTGPIYDRVALGIFDKKYDMARIQLNAEFSTSKGGIKIDNINQPRMLSTHVIVYTRAWGEVTPPSPKYGTQLVVENSKITKISSTKNIIPQNGYVIVGPQAKLNAFISAKNPELKLNTSPTWDNVEHIISGGPYLVKNGEIFVDMTAEKLNSIGGRNPRTAIGYTANNNLIMVTADGREGASIGLTLNELAQLMKELGCVNAMNLDGGGSTVMYVNGKVVNKPAVQGGIPLSHTLVIRKNYKISKI